MEQSFKRTKYACYTTNISTAIICNLSPILFITFRELYGISYTLLGLLVLVNFCTQLAIDLIFSFFSYKFNIPKTVKLTPVLCAIGLILYALSPVIFPNSVYVGLVLGTVIFSVSGGLSEVLISPTIAAIPAENPDHEMSKLHSIYAWGVVLVVVLGSSFLYAFGSKYWQILALVFALSPVLSIVLFAGAEIPKMETPERVSGALKLCKNKQLWLCVLMIFLGGASECTMSQWCSGYLEQALGLPKIWGDVFGLAAFGLTLGLGRTLYSKIGKNIGRVMCLGSIGAVACYLVCALVDIPVLGLIACAATGFFVSMLWPGSLVAASEKFPAGGVFIYAMMAAGGDFGAAVGPQLVGVVTDVVAASPFGIELAKDLALSPEQLGMKAGMLVGVLFPLLAIWLYLSIWKDKKKKAALPLSVE